MNGRQAKKLRRYSQQQLVDLFDRKPKYVPKFLWYWFMRSAMPK